MDKRDIKVAQEQDFVRGFTFTLTHIPTGLSSTASNLDRIKAYNRAFAELQILVLSKQLRNKKL
jgi:hypothetical protein